MVNKDLVKTKLNLIEEELVHLEEFKNFSFQEVVSDYKRQAIVERLLERIIGRAIDINQHLIAELFQGDIEVPKKYKGTFLALSELGVYPKDFAEQIAKSVGTRNVLVHDYDKVDYSQIYHSIKDCLKDYYTYCDYILKYIEAIPN